MVAELGIVAETASKNRHAFVMYYGPGCDFCQKVGAVWRQLAHELKDEKKEIMIEGQQGHVVSQALDGRVLVELHSRAREQDFALQYRRTGAQLGETRGVWLDLFQAGLPLALMSP